MSKVVELPSLGSDVNTDIMVIMKELEAFTLALLISYFI